MAPHEHSDRGDEDESLDVFRGFQQLVQRTPKTKVHARKANKWVRLHNECPFIGEVYNPKLAAASLSSRVLHRFAFAEMLMSMIFTVVSCGAVIASGTLTFQFNYRELTMGRLLCIALANGLFYAATVYALQPFSALPAVMRRRNRSSAADQSSTDDAVADDDSMALSADDSQSEDDEADATERARLMSSGVYKSRFASQLADNHRAEQDKTAEHLKDVQVTREEVQAPYLVGHVNPLVTLACWLVGEISFTHAFMFWSSQFFGSCIASVFLVVCIPDARSTQLGATVLADGTTPLRGFLVEFLLSLVFVSVVLRILVRSSMRSPLHPHLRQLAPALVGAIVFASTLIAGPITGASLNVARSFGPAVMSNTWEHHWLYWLAPLLGSAAASALVTLEKLTRRLLKSGSPASTTV